MKYLLIVVALVLGMESVSAESKEALVVGVSEYANKEKFKGVKIDVQRMKELFQKWDFNVTVVPSEESLSLEGYLKNYTNLKADDKFIFYYSGHGFHVPDRNDDEEDGEDEVLVLSNGKENKVFLDDTLNGYMNMIKASKMIMFDSCHSGTAFKAFGDVPKPKSLTSDLKIMLDVIEAKFFRKEEREINSGEYVVFSAAQDNEESLDTVNGGMFTSAFYNQINNNDGINIRMMNLKTKMSNDIAENCKPSNSTPHHPKLSASSKELRYSTIKDYLGL